MENSIVEMLKAYDEVYLKSLKKVAINSREEMTQFVNAIEYVLATKEIKGE